MSDKMREEFEAAVLNSELLPCNSIVKLEDSDEYSSVITGVAWLSWRISRATLCVDLPKRFSDERKDFSIGFDVAVEHTMAALHESGVRYK